MANSMADLPTTEWYRKNAVAPGTHADVLVKGLNIRPEDFVKLQQRMTEHLAKQCIENYRLLASVYGDMDHVFANIPLPPKPWFDQATRVIVTRCGETAEKSIKAGFHNQDGSWTEEGRKFWDREQSKQKRMPEEDLSRALTLTTASKRQKRDDMITEPHHPAAKSHQDGTGRVLLVDQTPTSEWYAQHLQHYELKHCDLARGFKISSKELKEMQKPIVERYLRLYNGGAKGLCLTIGEGKELMESRHGHLGVPERWYEHALFESAKRCDATARKFHTKGYIKSDGRLTSEWFRFWNQEDIWPGL